MYAIAFGWQNLQNMFGNKYYLNNQTANWMAGFCTGAGKTGSCWGWRNSDLGSDPSAVDTNFTPLNSIFVSP